MKQPVKRGTSMVNRTRQQARYTILRAHGVAPKLAERMRNSVDKFMTALRELGVDPQRYAELCVRLPSGRARLDTPLSRERTKRYHELRGYGLNSYQASEGAKSPGVFELVMRRIRRGLPCGL